jgi:uncharacterized membrane protein
LSFRDELERRSSRWVDEGLISADQRTRLLAAEETEPSAAPRLIAIFSLLGAALVVLGLILVISQNWEEIPKLTKLAAGVALMVAAFGVGYWLRFGPPAMVRTGEGVLLIGSGFFLGNLALISQQYNIDFNPSPLFLPVVLSAVVLAYVLNSRAYIFVAAALAVVWLIFESQRDHSAIETQNALALLMVAGGGVWLLIASEVNRRLGWPQFVEPTRIAGAATVFAAVYVLGFYRHYDPDDPLGVLPGVALVFVPLAIVAIALVVIASGSEERFGWARIEGRARRAVLATAVVLTALLAWSALVGVHPRGDAEEHFIAYTVGFWVLALVMSADLAWLGLALRREWWINAALAYVGVFAISRYFDLFSDYAQTGAVFAGAGLFLLVLAFALERGRRALRAELSDDGAAGRG